MADTDSVLLSCFRIEDSVEMVRKGARDAAPPPHEMDGSFPQLLREVRSSEARQETLCRRERGKRESVDRQKENNRGICLEPPFHCIFAVLGSKVACTCGERRQSC